MQTYVCLVKGSTTYWCFVRLKSKNKVLAKRKLQVYWKHSGNRCVKLPHNGGTGCGLLGQVFPTVISRSGVYFKSSKQVQTHLHCMNFPPSNSSRFSWSASGQGENVSLWCRSKDTTRITACTTSDLQSLGECMLQVSN